MSITDTTKTVQLLQDRPTERRQIDISIAPDCEGGILSEVPRVTVCPNGKPYIALTPLVHEDEIGEEVEATASLRGSDVMLVCTKEGVYLMRQSGYEANLPTPMRTPDELHRQDVHNNADGVIAGLMSDFNPTGTAELLWDVGNNLVMRGERYGRMEGPHLVNAY